MRRRKIWQPATCIWTGSKQTIDSYFRPLASVPQGLKLALFHHRPGNVAKNILNHPESSRNLPFTFWVVTYDNIIKTQYVDKIIYLFPDEKKPSVAELWSTWPQFCDCGRRAADSCTACCSSSPRLLYMPSYARLFRGMVRAFTLPEVNCLLELEPQWTLPDPTHIGGLLGFILM